MKFREIPIYIDSERPRSFFPEKFSNDIYYSKINSFSRVEYESSFSIKFCISGQEQYFVDGERKIINSGEYLIVNEGMFVVNSDQGVSEALSLFLDPDIISDVLNNYNKSDKQLLENPDNRSEIINFFSDIFVGDKFGIKLKRVTNLIKKSALSSTEINPEIYYNLACWLIESQIKIRENIFSIDKVKLSTREELFRRINLAVNFLNRNKVDKFSLEKLSKASHLSKFHLSRTFKEVTGLTPFEFHNQIRLKYAAKLISKGDYTYSEVSEILNFSSPSAFSTTFKSYFGKSPSQYFSPKTAIIT